MVAPSVRAVVLVRPSKLFTAHASAMEAIAGSLKPDKHHQVVNAVVRLISGGS